MKLKAIQLTVLAILVSFVVSVGGNALACLSPFTMNYEKTLMTCNSSMPPVNSVPVQSDTNCKDSLFKDGQVHHVKSSSHLLIFEDFQVASLSLISSTGISMEEPSVPVFFSEDRLSYRKYSSVPLYTFHHSFLI
jgi:hypothetical protein